MSEVCTDLPVLSSSYERLHNCYVSRKSGRRWSPQGVLASVCVVVLGVLLALAVIHRLKAEHERRAASLPDDTPTDTPEISRAVLVETLPPGVCEKQQDVSQNLRDSWKHLLSLATEQLDISSFYWTLTAEDIQLNTSADAPGREILEELKSLSSRNVSVRVVSSRPTVARGSTDLRVLQEHGVRVRVVDFGRLTRGILHAKFWVVDRKHIYIGSANMDWRALTEVKELGVVLYNSTRLASDLLKIFRSYWVMGRENATLPEPWPHPYDTQINAQRPLTLQLSGVPSSVYISASPPAFCPSSRTRDLDALLMGISEAQQFVHVSVMEYYPATKFFHQHRFWPVLEETLKRAAFERRVCVRVLVSCGLESDWSVWPFLRSLDALHSHTHNISISVRVFVIPTGNASHVPYTRIDHSKYMVTDRLVYIGTSNWSADYFSRSAGVGVVIRQEASRGPSLHSHVGGAFLRDWSSRFSLSLAEARRSGDCSFSRTSHNEP